MSDSHENRNAPRIPARHGVWCESESLTLLTQTVNLSSTGAFIRTPQPLAPGTVVHLRFTDLDVSFESEVVWVRRSSAPPAIGSDPPGMGVRFLADKGHEAYEAMLKQLAGAQYRTPGKPSDSEP